MQKPKHVIMIGGCLEQFEQYRLYPEIRVTVLANGDDLKEAAEAGLDCYEVDPQDHRLCLSVIVDNRLAINLYAIYSFIEYGLETAAFLGEALGVRCNPLKPVIQTRNKHLMRLSLSQLCPHLSVPYLHPSNKRQIADFFEKQGKIVVKPIDGAGSIGVRTISSLAELDQLDDDGTGQICEKFIGGKEFSVESMSAHGEHQIIAVTEKYTTGQAPFVELAHIVPARLSAEDEALIKQAVLTFLHAIGQKHGPAHTEVKLYRGDVYIIESQTRLGGDRIWKLCELATGYNFIHSFVNQVLLNREYKFKSQDQIAAISFFTPAPGIVKKIEIPSDITDNQGIINLNVECKIGDTIPELMSSLDRSGSVILSAENYEALAQLMEDLKRVHLETHCA